MLKTKVRANYR